MLNQSSMWWSQLVCFGVYRNRMRWLTSRKNAARVGIDCHIPLFQTPPDLVVKFQPIDIVGFIL